MNDFLFGTCRVGTSVIESRKIGSLSHRFFIFCLTVLDVQLMMSDFSLYSGYITITGRPSVLIP